MYNGHKIKELLEERGLKYRTLLDALGINDNGSIQRLTSGDIKASRLEQVADFFGVSIETFFERDVQVVNSGGGSVAQGKGSKAVVNNGSNDRLKNKLTRLEDQIATLNAENAMLAERIKDKEKVATEMEGRIHLLEELLNIYRPKQQSRQ